MKTLQFATICFYYYGREAAKNPAYTISALAMLYFTHKLASWALWVMCL